MSTRALSAYALGRGVHRGGLGDLVRGDVQVVDGLADGRKPPAGTPISRKALSGMLYSSA